MLSFGMNKTRTPGAVGFEKFYEITWSYNWVGILFKSFNLSWRYSRVQVRKKIATMFRDNIVQVQDSYGEVFFDFLILISTT